MVINSTTVTEPTTRGQPTGENGLKNGNTEHSGYRMKVDGTDPVFGDWRDDLVRDGYAVVKGAVPPSRALEYADKMYSLVESFGLGYDRNDPSTVHPDKLPVINEKGMLLPYGACHEAFVWDIRSEEGVLSTFEKVYGTEDLLVSFDTINYGFHNRKNLPSNSPWPHQDQDPEIPGFRCLQGLVNLLPNGPNDGGLIVCKGAHLLSEEYHDHFRGKEDRIPQWTNEWYGFKDEGMQWLKDRGCEWVKLEAEPGDLLLWDSRAPHYNVPATGNQDRLAIYTCYMPVADASQDDLIRKKDAWDRKVGTTHWPNAQVLGTNTAIRNGKPESVQRERPLHEPVLSERAFKLTGIPYIKA
ncbi:hypothetical protein INS49_011076 [Diaporthe citri]|uniref:uncharacterized protein n=1 Tax=Diaporthe citri TaxID=83186 RepID=UPI001C7FC48B|nr:uncharacterized protein INS49_011076 [Diaporthe citri]KAG6360020.1 hypothetical protein INS49_011076 [Diaporthe citri]